MMGPLFFGFALSISGLIQLSVPYWLPHLAQFVIGTALGSQFSGISTNTFSRGLEWELLSAFICLWLVRYLRSLYSSMCPQIWVLFVSFAAGGLAEMSLIALSLNFNPVVVEFPPVSIVLTVGFVYFAKRILKI